MEVRSKDKSLNLPTQKRRAELGTQKVLLITHVSIFHIREFMLPCKNILALSRHVTRRTI